MRIKKFGLLLLVLLMLTCSMQLSFAETSVDRALLIQGDLPWGSNTNTVVLNQLVSAGYYTGYDIKTATEVSNENFDLSGYKIVIFANDQSQISYNQYSDILKNKLEVYANLGGVVIFGICDMGWNSGTLSAPLPGGITKTNVYQPNNYIVDSTNPVVTGELSDNIALTNSDLVGSFCSHASFIESSLPEGTKVILRGSNDNLPTLVDYTYGTGHIIASGLTWEVGYTNKWGFATKAYDDLLIYALEVANGIGESDLKAYNEALGKATESIYTLESWAEYKSVVEANLVTGANSQAEVDTATNNILEAQNNLIKKVDVALAAAKAAEKLLIATDYVDYSDVTKALSMPEETDEEKVAKISSIENAMEALVIKKANAYTMNGFVIEEGNGNNVVGATVKLMIGSLQVEKTTTDSNGAFKINNVSNGTYNLVISKGEQTVTLIISVLNNDVSTGSIILPNGKKNSIVEVKNDNLNIVVGNLNDYFNSNQFTDDEENVVENGGTVEIKLTVEEKSEDEADNSVKIKAVAGNSKTIGMYLDLNLNKVITTGSAIATTGSAISGTYAINELQNVLIINIQLPTELQGKNGYVIYRYHGTEVQTISKEINSDGEYFILNEGGKVLTLFTKKFSTYALGYSTAISNDENHENSDDEDVTATTPIITSDSNAGGNVKISNDKKTAEITPDYGYVIADVIVDGKSVGATSTYNFSGSKNHNIKAVFVEETALPYYIQDDKKVFIGFAATMDNLLKYTELNGRTVQFARNPKSFTDNVTHWAKDTIEFVTEREILVGTENSKFSPNTSMTRAMFVTAIGRLYEHSYGRITGNTTFSDVDTDAYYSNYVAWAHENNIIRGTDENNFSPDKEVTREQMSEIIYRFAKYLDKEPIGNWMINVTYSDKSEISDWALNSAAYCQLTNIITGRENNEFAPNETATRAEVAAVIERFVKEMLK